MRTRKTPPRPSVDIEIKQDKCAIKNSYGEIVCYLSTKAAERMGLITKK